MSLDIKEITRRELVIPKIKTSRKYNLEDNPELDITFFDLGYRIEGTTSKFGFYMHPFTMKETLETSLDRYEMVDGGKVYANGNSAVVVNSQIFIPTYYNADQEGLLLSTTFMDFGSNNFLNSDVALSMKHHFSQSMANTAMWLLQIPIVHDAFIKYSLENAN